MNKQKWLIFTFLITFLCKPLLSQNYEVVSPDGNLKMSVSITEQISYSVEYKGDVLIMPSLISMTLEDGRTIGQNAILESEKDNIVNDVITVPYGIAYELDESYAEKILNFTDGYSLIIRAYDEGVAYRFATRLDGEIIVKSEQAEFNIKEDPRVWYPLADDLMRSFERAYKFHTKVSDITMEDTNGKRVTSMAITPTLFSYNYSDRKVRLIVAESDLSDYPGLYIDRADKNSTKMIGKWAAYPKKVSEPDNIYAYHRVEERYDYIAKTNGTREFPWRVIIATDNDKSLLTNQLIFKLAKPLQLTNTDWIKPGKSVWEWWHDANLEGVNPGGKVSLDVYKYYIDYGAKYGFEYLTMDSQWKVDFAKDVVNYAKSKNIKVIAWDFVNMPIEDQNRLDYMKSLGFAGIKVDLIERDDQIAMNWVETLAKECAERELLLVLHGCPVPTGLERAYPNIVNYEAIRGAECLKWDKTANPDYHVEFPFIRMLAGPVDYTPGSMRNVHVEEFKPIGTGVPMSMGTRSHEMAMYIMYYQPLAYFCDTPIEYAKYDKISRFFEVLPTVWDESIALDAEVGKYAVIARRSGDDWFIGGMNNTSSRKAKLDFSFLPSGTYKATIFRDDKMSDLNAKSQTVEVMDITNTSQLNIDVTRSGGFVIYLSADGNALVDGKDPLSPVSEEVIIYLSADKNQLTVETGEEEIKSVIIYDSVGRIKLKAENDPVFSEKNRQYINVMSLSNGVYFTVLKTNKKTYKIKFIK